MSLRLLFAVGAYLLALTYSGLVNDFDTDDMMNLYGAWHRFPEQVRPAGALFYRAVFEGFGFHSLPFRLADFALILVNLALLARLLTRLTPSPAAALFFGCFQGTMWMIYASTGMIYDVLCATFLYAALLVAIERPRWWLAVALLHIGAVSAKELGVTLPVILLLYSYVYRRLPAKLFLATSAVSLFFAAQRLLLPGPLTGHPAYTPVFTLARILENITVYTTILFSHAIRFTPLAAVLFWLGIIALAAALRSRPMLFGVCFFWLALSPMLLATPRHAGYVFYVPILGLAVAVGAAYAALLPQSPRLKAALFVTAVLALHLYQKRVSFRRGETPSGHTQIRQLAALRLPLSAGQRILFVNTPAPRNPHLAIFTLTLTHRVRDLSVDELDAVPPNSTYDHILYFSPDGAALAYQPVTSLAMDDPRAPLALLHDIGPLQDGHWRWTGPAPAFRFTTPPVAAHFVLHYTVADVTFAQTGPLNLLLTIAGSPPTAHRLTHPGSGILRVPATLPPGQRVIVCLRIANPYVSPTDGARLGLIVSRAGFE